MAKTPPHHIKAIVLRIWIWLFLIGLGMRIFQITLLGEAPVVRAAETALRPLVAPVLVEGTAPPNPVGNAAGLVTSVHLAWLHRCESAEAPLGLYTPGDALCQPRRAVSLNWLQSQLVAAGALAGGEYLEGAADPNQPARLAAVLSGPTAQPVGWLWADERGLYRVDLDGQVHGARFQVWIQGR